MNILIISGSLRKLSMNSGVARYAASLLGDIEKCEVADISSVPLFNQDLEKELPLIVTALKDKIKAADGILIVSPEYNRSIPGVLKNVIDWASRPYGENAWKGKPVGVTGVTTGMIGTAVAQYHLKHVFNCLGTHIMGQPELFLPNAKEYFDERGDLTDQKTKDRIKEFLEKFKAHISIFLR